VDDHPIVRAGLRQVLAAAGLAVTAEGTNGAEALRLAAEVHPDVLVLDVNLPDMNGLEVTRRLRARGTTPAILILTIHDDAQMVLGLLEAGAAGYVLKDDATETLADAVYAVARGESWLSPKVAREVMRYVRREPSPEEKFPLTPRELEVLSLMAQGLDNETIAQRLTLTRRTVQNHVSAIYDKLQVKTRTEAMLYAIQRRLVHVPASGSSTPDSR
jgi:DNA-binding NarL/FixJ family response regulator